MTDTPLEAKLRQVRLFREVGHPELLEGLGLDHQEPKPHSFTPQNTDQEALGISSTHSTPPESEPIEAPSRFLSRLQEEKSWQNRLLILAYWLKETLQTPKFPKSESKALLPILQNPLAWIPQEPAAWEGLGRLIADALPLCQSTSTIITPKILCSVFETLRLEFCGSPLEMALWRFATHPSFSDHLRGLAHLHLFLAGGEKLTSSLWLARNFIIGEDLVAQSPSARQWTSLHLWALEVLQHPQFLRHSEREAMSFALRAAASPGVMRVAEVEAYLKSGAEVPLYVLEEIQWFARREQSKSLESLALELTSQKLYPTNQALFRIMSIVPADQVDLGWRAMTILHSRRSLKGYHVESWRMSGENRTHFFFSPIEKSDLPLLLKAGLSEEEWLFVESYLNAAPSLGEQFCAVAKEGKPYEFGKVPKGSYEEETRFFLKSLKLFASPPKAYARSHQALKEIPIWGFASVSYQTKSSMLFHYLTKILNLHLWDNDYTLLLDTFQRLPPYVNPRGEALVLAAKSLTPERARFIMQTTALRMTSAMMPNHYEMLLCLQDLKAPLTLLRCYETWLVSSAYTLFRKRKRVECMIPFRV